MLRRILIYALIAVTGLQFWFLGRVLWWRYNDPAETAFMAAGLARLQEDNPDAFLKHRWAPYARISVHLKRAVVAAEDSRFIAHEGFDWEGIEKAVEKNIQKGRFAAGGSTISQQLAKNLFLSPSKNPLRKAQEAVITVMIEVIWPKRRILEVYLNVIEWGSGIYGAEAAARRYFGSRAADLGPGEAAHLAAMIPNPRYYEKHRGARGLLKRQDLIAARMWQVSIPK